MAQIGNSCKNKLISVRWAKIGISGGRTNCVLLLEEALITAKGRMSVSNRPAREEEEEWGVQISRSKIGTEGSWRNP